jgi:molybdenum cofactor cytidylyltransferase
VNLAAIVLAAGAGRRFGGGKLSARFRDEPLIAHAIRAARAAPVERVIVVCPATLDIGLWPGMPLVEALRIDSPELSASLQAGIAAAGDCGGAFVFLGDMPLVPHEVAGELAATLGKNYAALPRRQGKHGHPVLLSAKAFPAMATLTGDEGAGRLLKARRDIAFLDCPDDGVLLDIDRAEDLARLEQHGGA